MNSVNQPTKMLLDCFRRKSEEHSGPEYNSGHPFFAAAEAAVLLGLDVDSEEFRGPTTRSLQLWSANMIGGMIVEVLNEISAVGKIAMEAGEAGKSASTELLSSMDFVRAVFQAWANEVDLEHIAEFVFEDGMKRYKAAVAADPEAFKPKEKLSPQEIIEALKKRLEAAADRAEAARAEEKKKKADSPPVTPADIMKMLFENKTKPSVN